MSKTRATHAPSPRRALRAALGVAACLAAIGPATAVCARPLLLISMACARVTSPRPRSAAWPCRTCVAFWPKEPMPKG